MASVASVALLLEGEPLISMGIEQELGGRFWHDHGDVTPRGY